MEHDKHFNGEIRRTAEESTPSWGFDESVLARRPNIVMVVLDDVGYSQLGCYGSDIETPALDSLASDGLRYANFHVTPLCSPTRTCLLTGRNHHSVGMGRVAEMTNGFPNTRGIVSRDAANIAELLKPHGYQTLCAGKWHLSTLDSTSPAGPYDHWPLQRGFDRFYGFLAGETNQWSPELVMGNERIEQPPGDDYHLSEDIVDQACKWLRQLVSADPDTPFFLYVAFAAGHSPHHVPREYADKYCGRFDDGWDVARQRVLAKQKETGLLPEHQDLAPRNPGVQVWDDLDSDEKRLAARMQEVFAGFLDHADVQVGRLLDQIDALGKRDDSIVMAMSDNGASAEGGPHGTYDHQRSRNGFGTTVEANLARLEDMGGPFTYNNYPFGWAMAGNTPFKRYKGNTYAGGIRAPLLIRWPDGIAAKGETRRQFYHAVDVVPTLIDLLGMPMPDQVLGVPQMPLHGTSMARTLNDNSAETGKKIQYFETIGQRALWHEGWKAVTFHERDTSFDDDVWELYHLDEDLAELNNLAEAHPAKLEELIELWWREAERYGVLPLDDLNLRKGVGWWPERKDRWVLYQDAVLPHFFKAGPRVRGLSHRITARIERTSVRDDGVIIADGGRFGGWSVFVRDNRLHYTTNNFGERCRISSPLAIPSGSTTLRIDVVRSGKDEGKARFFIDGRAAGEGLLSPFRHYYFVNEPLDVGRDSQTPVDEQYESPFVFKGRIVDVVIEAFGSEVVDQDALLDELMASQ
ncbi:MAG: arylsulfatase [Gemmatimonadota bacterium]|jgi:arylsulfatase A-like enzyme|nr:arylsulfatase [Gemmatimonadota bacterium]